MGFIRYSRLQQGNRDKGMKNPHISVSTQAFYSNGIQVQMGGRNKIFYEMVSAMF